MGKCDKIKKDKLGTGDFQKSPVPNEGKRRTHEKNTINGNEKYHISPLDVDQVMLPRISVLTNIQKKSNTKCCAFITLRANKGGNVKIDVHGEENIPAENGFMFFPNHQGLYDVLAVVEACPKPFSVVAKKEIANIPFLL